MSKSLYNHTSFDVRGQFNNAKLFYVDYFVNIQQNLSNPAEGGSEKKMAGSGNIQFRGHCCKLILVFNAVGPDRVFLQHFLLF